MIDGRGWNIDGQDCTGDAAAYVLGALEEREVSPFLAHLEVCAICRDEVSSLQVVADMLPASVTPVTAPRGLRRRVLSTVSEEAELFRAAGARREPARRRARFRPVPRGFQALALAAIAAAAVAVGTLAFGGGGSRATRVIQASATSPTTAVLRLNSGHTELDIAKLPAATIGTVYEVWVKRPGRTPQATDTLFTPTSAGRATVELPGDVGASDAVMVTNEPAGGSPQPTSSPVVRASLQ